MLTPFHRRLLFFFFFFTFLVSAPLILLRTAGYQFHWKAKKFVQTSILSLNSYPARVSLQVDGEERATKTPVFLSDMLPGVHEISVTAQGYTSWKKQLSFESRQTTFVTDAVLFPEANPTLREPLPLPSTTAIEPVSGDRAFLLEQDSWVELWLLSHGQKQLLLRHPTTKKPSFALTWSPKGDYLLVRIREKGEKEVVLIRTSTRETIPLPDTFVQADAFTFDASGFARLFAQFDEGWRGYDIEKRAEELLPPSPQSWQSHGSRWYSLEPRGEHIGLLDRAPDQKFSTILTLPLSNYRFVPAPTPYVSLEDTSRHRLYVFDLTGEKPEVVLNAPATLWQWSAGRLVYSDGYEIHVLTPKQGTDETLTRVSEPIVSLILSPVAPWVFYAQDKAVYALEFDGRDVRNRPQLVSGFEHVRDLWTDATATVLQFEGVQSETKTSGFFDRPLGL